MGEDAFYVDPSDLTVVRVKGINRHHVDSIETTPSNQHVILRIGTIRYYVSYVYNYSNKKLTKLQQVDRDSSFYFVDLAEEETDLFSRLYNAPATLPVYRLNRALNDERAYIVEAVCKAMAGMSPVDETVMSSLVANLRHFFPWVRQATATTLGSIGDPKALPFLIDARGDEDKLVNFAILEATMSIVSKNRDSMIGETMGSQQQLDLAFQAAA